MSPSCELSPLRENNKFLENTIPPKTNMTMEHPPFEDVFPIENGDFPMSC